VFGLLLGLAFVEIIAVQIPSLFLRGAIRTPSEVRKFHQEAMKSLFSGYDVKSPYTQLNTQRIYRIGVPGIKYAYYGLDFSSKVSYNFFGIRDREPDYLTPNRPVTLLIGDSIVEGREVDSDITMSHQLELILEAKGTPWWIVNAGLGGTGTVNQLHVLDHLGPIYRSKKVILFFNLGNDLRNNNLLLEAAHRASSYMKTQYSYYWKLNREEDFRYIEIGTDFIDILDSSHYDWLHASTISIKECRRKIRSNSSDYKIIKWCEEKSEAYQLLQHRLAITGRYRCQPKMEGVPLYLLHETTVAPEIQEQTWEVTTFLIDNMKSMSKKLNSEFFVVIFPNRFRVDKIAREATLKKYGISAEEIAEKGPQDRLATILSDKGIPWLDLTETFLGYPDVSELYLPVDGHLSAIGHRLVAEKLANIFYSIELSNSRKHFN
jgi:hypothetical protein